MALFDTPRSPDSSRRLRERFERERQEALRRQAERDAAAAQQQTEQPAAPTQRARANPGETNALLQSPRTASNAERLRARLDGRPLPPPPSAAPTPSEPMGGTRTSNRGRANAQRQSLREGEEFRQGEMNRIIAEQTEGLPQTRGGRAEASRRAAEVRQGFEPPPRGLSGRNLRGQQLREQRQAGAAATAATATAVGASGVQEGPQDIPEPQDVPVPVDRGVPTSLSTVGGTVARRPPSRPAEATPNGTVPRDVVEVIRPRAGGGFNRTYEGPGVPGGSVQAVEGGTFQQALEAARFRDEGFRQSEEARRADQDAASRSTQATAALTAAVANSQTFRLNEDGNIVGSTLNPETMQYEDTIASPIIKEMITKPEEYTIEDLNKDNPLAAPDIVAISNRDPSKVVRVDTRTDQQLAWQAMFEKRRQAGESAEDIIEDFQEESPYTNFNFLR